MYFQRPFLTSILFLLSAGTMAENTVGLREELESQIAAGTRNIKLTRSEYDLTKTLMLRNLDGIAIDGNNARITMRSLSEAIRLIDCKRVTLKNFSLDYNPLPFTQGVITEISPDWRNITFRIDAGYPRLSPGYANRRIHIFTPDGKFFKHDSPDIYGDIEIVGPDCGICHAERPQKSLAIGDRIALDQRHDAAIHFSRCEKMRIESITVFSSPGLVFRSRFGFGDDEFIKVKITRGPRPPGASTDRLLSSSADGINFAYLRKGPKIIECDFSYMGDDGVNLHSVALPITTVLNSDEFDTIRPDRPEDFPQIIMPGDKIRLLHPANYAVIGERTIRRVRLSPRHYSHENFLKFYSHRTFQNWTAYEITLEPGQPELKPGVFFDIPAIAGNNYEISNNYFHDHRACGLRLMASDGIIANNRFARIKHAAIAVGAEYGYWREAGWVENIRIENNRINDVGHGMNSNIGSYINGAISVFCRLEDYSGTFKGNRKITIEGNEIDICPGAGIFLYGADSVIVKKNRLYNTATSRIIPGSNHGFKDMQPLWIVNSSSVSADPVSQQNIIQAKQNE